MEDGSVSSDVTWLESMPEVYDRELGPALFHPFAEHLASLTREMAPGRVLELAAGTGIATSALARALPDSHITATDLNPAMVSWAAQREPRATWLEADAQALQFSDGSFDLVVCQFGVMFFPDKPAAFAEAARVMAPGGTLLFAVWDVVEVSPFPAAMMASLSTMFPDDPPGFIVRLPHGYADPDQIRADVQAGGLVVESLQRVVLTGTASSAEGLTEGFCLGTPLRFALQERGELDVLIVQLTEQMVTRLGPGPLEGESAAFVITARRAP